MTVVTRFAPSPTGNLHIGGARTALFAWAFARQHSGQFILRIEDTDLARSTPESTRGIIRDLLWLGLNWDQGPALNADPNLDPYDRQTQIGEHGPYFQSKRHADGTYDRMIEKLLSEGKAYEDGDAVRFRMDKTVTFEDAVYGRIEVKAEDLEDFIIRKGEKGGGLPTFHFAVTVDDALMDVTHVIRGQEHLANTPKHAALCDALGYQRPKWVHLPSIMNADGSKMSKRDKAKAARKAVEAKGDQFDYEAFLEWADHLPHKMPKGPLWFEHEDDSIRFTTAIGPGAEDQLKSTKEIFRIITDAFLKKENDNVIIANMLAAYCGIQLPEIEVADFKYSGYLPNVILNYIALLGWNPGDDIERFDLDFLVKHFSLERIGKKNSQFDRVKLARFNAEAFSGMDPERFHELLRDHFAVYRPASLGKLGDTGFRTFASMYQARSQTLDTPAELGRFFVCNDDEIVYDDKAVSKNLTKNNNEGLNVLKQFREVLAQCDNWTAEALHKLIESFATEHQLKNMGSVAQPLRVALTGSAVSPEIGPTLELLGRQTVLNRIDRCIQAVSC